MLLRAFISFLIAAFAVPFITYDTGVRCITHPCSESASRGSLLEFLLKSQNLNAYIIDYYILVVAFIGIFLIILFIDKLANKNKQDKQKTPF